MKPSTTYTIVFICQQGDIETKSVLLAASLKKHLQGNYELIAAIPKMYGEIYYPSNTVLQFFKKLNIRVEVIENIICNNRKQSQPGDAIANKIFCFTIKTTSEKIIFLDSDMLCLQKTNLGSLSNNVNFYAKQADYNKIKNWNVIYKIFNLPPAKLNYRCCVDNELSPLYFNSGFIATSNEITNKLFNKWYECFTKLSVINNNTIPYINRDQISLTIAVQVLNINYKLLGNEYNFPVRSMGVKKNNIPFFAHYHSPQIILYNPILFNKFNHLINDYIEIKNIINENKNWKLLLTETLNIIHKVKRYYYLTKNNTK